MRISRGSTRCRRSGYSLIELCGMISLILFISVLATSLLALLFRLDNRVTTSAIVQTTLQRLEDQLWHDARFAQAVESTNNGFRLRDDESGNISYEFNENRIVRKDERHSNKSTSRFDFRSASFQTTVTDHHLQLSIVFHDDGSTSDSASIASDRPLRETALEIPVGRGYRYLTNATVEGAE